MLFRSLIFKKSQAISCANAFKVGVAKNGSKVDTVISVFVSRVDRALDATLSKNGVEVALSGIYNSADIYEAIESLHVEGTRTLFASTGVKDDSLPAHYYIEKLLAYNSVNTAPIDTIKAFKENGKNDSALPINAEMIKEHFNKVKSCGIDFEAVLDKQIEDGLEQFKDAFKEILESL